jgi:hypothetical protein
MAQMGYGRLAAGPLARRELYVPAPKLKCLRVSNWPGVWLTLTLVG